MLGSVPFELYGSHAYASAMGILRVEGEELVFELSTRNPWIWIKSPPREIRIPLTDVDALRFERHWYLFHVWLRLRVRKLEYFAGVPTANGAEVILWCKRRYKGLAYELSNNVTLRLLERVLTDEDGTPAGIQTR
jgi:hypothetical protein